MLQAFGSDQAIVTDGPGPCVEMASDFDFGVLARALASQAKFRDVLLPILDGAGDPRWVALPLAQLGAVCKAAQSNCRKCLSGQNKAVYCLDGAGAARVVRVGAARDDFGNLILTALQNVEMR